MRFRPRLHPLAALLVLASAGAAQTLTLLPDTWPRDVTPSGGHVVGARFTAPGGAQPVGVRWSGSPFMTEFPDVSSVAGSSEGGNLLTGVITPPGGLGSQLARWFILSGWTPLGPLPGGPTVAPMEQAEDISADGTVVVGVQQVPVAGGWAERASRWTAATGSVALAPIPDQLGSRAQAVSADGLVACGSAWSSAGWYAVIWHADGSVTYPLGPPGAPTTPRAYATEVDSDGRTVVGGYLDRLEAWVWREEWGVIDLGPPGGVPFDGNRMEATAVADGGVLVGGGTSATNGGVAWVWTPAGGVRELEDVAEGLGLGPWPDHLGAPVVFQEVRDVSADGSRLVGAGDVDGFWSSKGGWVLDIPTPAAIGSWEDLGLGLSGPFDPTPLLTALGAQTSGAETTLTLALQPAFCTVSLVIGLSRIDAPFKGGVMVPHPDVVISFLNLGQTAPISTSFPWPAGVPSGFEIHWQYWMTNGGGPAGFNASNAVRSTTP